MGGGEEKGRMSLKGYLLVVGEKWGELGGLENWATEGCLRLTIGVSLEQLFPTEGEQGRQTPALRQAQAEGECGRFRELRHQPTR